MAEDEEGINACDSGVNIAHDGWFVRRLILTVWFADGLRFRLRWLTMVYDGCEGKTETRKRGKKCLTDFERFWSGKRKNGKGEKQRTKEASQKLSDFPLKGNGEMKKLKNRKTDLDFFPPPRLKKEDKKFFPFPLFPFSLGKVRYIHILYYTIIYYCTIQYYI